MTLRAEILLCTRCELADHCRHPVPYHVPPDRPAPYAMAVVGEAPGWIENEMGRPFIGPAGQLLRRELRDVGLDDADCAWLNVACCFPGELRTPNPTHIQACKPNLYAQLGVISPSFVLVAGRMAWDNHRWAHLGESFGFKAWRCLHPSACLRTPTLIPQLRSQLRVFVEEGPLAMVEEAFGV